MKNLLFSILIVSFFASAMYAQSDYTTKRSNEYYSKALEQYLVCLNHHNDGVVESAIINLMKMNRERSDLSYQTTIDRLDTMSTEGRTANIRFLAFIAAKYLDDPENPELFSEIKIEDDEQLISMLLDRLQ